MTTQAEVQRYLAGLIADAMYMKAEEIEEDLLFSSFGLESSTLVKIVHHLNQHYASTIDIRELLPHQTLREATQFVYEKVSTKPVTT
jgi:acyl carrier protein